jgi:glycosyltransferase involved in cell wall biosynthesis
MTAHDAGKRAIERTSMARPVSIVTVTYDTFFFVRLLVEKVREFIGNRAYEIIVVDRGSTDGTLEWCAQQADIRVVHVPQTGPRHEHGKAAEKGVRAAKHEIIVFMDSDAHPVSPDWLQLTADKLGDDCRLAGPKVIASHPGNPFGWYIHPHFMVFHKEDLGGDVVLRKVRREKTDTGEEATLRLLRKGRQIEALPLESCSALYPGHPLTAYSRFSFEHPHFPTIGAGVFHAWYGTRLRKDAAVVNAESAGAITPDHYQQPLVAMLREFYGLSY